MSRSIFRSKTPELAEVRGPLSSANEPLPWLIFTRPAWRKEIERHYAFEARPFPAVHRSGVLRDRRNCHRIPMPFWMYRTFFAFDLGLSRLFPRAFAAFFTITLRRK